MAIQGALNGDRRADEHPALPLTLDALVADAVACAAAGATSVHLHPRGPDGSETLAPEVVDAVAGAVREAASIPCGVSTGAWIVPDERERHALIGAWSRPDFASVNLSDPDAPAVIRLLASRGIGVEAGLWSRADAQRLVDEGLADVVLRCLVEPMGDEGVDAALRHAADVHAVLDATGVTAPRLQHSDGVATWPLLRDALARGLDTRVGFEDVLVGPAGERVADNATLVRAACGLT